MESWLPCTLRMKVSCRPMINRPPGFKGVNMRIPIIIPIKGRGSINQGSGFGFRFGV